MTFGNYVDDILIELCNIVNAEVAHRVIYGPIDPDVELPLCVACGREFREHRPHGDASDCPTYLHERSTT